MSLLLIGCGYWGDNWAQTLTKLNALGAICELDASRHEAIAAKYPGVKIYGDSDSAMQHPGLSGAVIATPVPTHFPLAMRCVEQRLPVMVEKPMTTTLREANELMAAADKNNVLVAVGHLLMYHPALVEIRRRIDEGELGEILAVHCTRAKMGKIRNEENVWLSFAPHDLSILIYLLGEPLRTVSAVPYNFLKREGLEDGVFASFETPSGKEASIFVSWLYPFKKMETIVVGSKQIAIFEDTVAPDQKLRILPYELATSGKGQQLQVENLKASAAEVVSYPHQDPLEVQAQAFLSAIQDPPVIEGRTMPNHGENARIVVELLEKVQTMMAQKNIRV